MKKQTLTNIIIIFCIIFAFVLIQIIAHWNEWWLTIVGWIIVVIIIGVVVGLIWSKRDPRNS